MLLWITKEIIWKAILQFLLIISGVLSSRVCRVVACSHRRWANVFFFRKSSDLEAVISVAWGPAGEDAASCRIPADVSVFLRASWSFDFSLIISLALTKQSYFAVGSCSSHSREWICFHLPGRRTRSSLRKMFVPRSIFPSLSAASRSGEFCNNGARATLQTRAHPVCWLQGRFRYPQLLSQLRGHGHSGLLCRLRISFRQAVSPEIVAVVGHPARCIVLSWLWWIPDSPGVLALVHQLLSFAFLFLGKGSSDLQLFLDNHQFLRCTDLKKTWSKLL